MGLTAREVHCYCSAKWAQTGQTNETRQMCSPLCPSMVFNTVENNLFLSLTRPEMADDFICRWDILKNIISYPRGEQFLSECIRKNKYIDELFVYAYVPLSTTIKD